MTLTSWTQPWRAAGKLFPKQGKVCGALSRAFPTRKVCERLSTITAATRPTIDAHKKLSGRKAENYRQSHEAEFIIYEAALRQLKVLAPGKKLPATSKLNTEIEALISEKNAAYNTYRTAKAEYEQLATAKRNAEQILHGTPSRQKKHEQER